MKHYRASGRARAGDLVTLCLCVVVAGGIAGTVANVVGNWYRILVLFPLLIGLAVGEVAQLVVKRRRVRAPVAAALIAFIGGAFGWGTDMGIGYLRARSHVAEQIAPLVGRVGPIDRGAVGRAVNFLLVKWSRGDEVTEGQVLAVLTGGPAGLSRTLPPDAPREPSLIDAAWSYLQLRAAAGMKIVDEEGAAYGFLLAETVNAVAGKTMVADPKEEGALGKNGTWIVWFFEVVCAGGFAAFLAFDTAGEPFCEACGTWYGAVSGRVKVGAFAEGQVIKNELQRFDLDSLGKRLAQRVTWAECVVMVFRHCPTCMAAPVFTELVLEKGNGSSTLASGLLPRDAFDRLVGTGKT